MRGNLAPEGAVVKIAGKKVLTFRGTCTRVRHAKKRRSRRSTRTASSRGMFVVIRYEGPHGGQGMREMLAVSAAIVGTGNQRPGRLDH